MYLFHLMYQSDHKLVYFFFFDRKNIIPRLFDEFINFMTTLSVTFPDLVNSDQISLFFQSVSSELSSITQNLVKSSIAGIQSTISVLLYIILFL